MVSFFFSPSPSFSRVGLLRFPVYEVTYLYEAKNAVGNLQISHHHYIGSLVKALIALNVWHFLNVSGLRKKKWMGSLCLVPRSLQLTQLIRHLSIWLAQYSKVEHGPQSSVIRSNLSRQPNTQLCATELAGFMFFSVRKWFYWSQLENQVIAALKVMTWIEGKRWV